MHPVLDLPLGENDAGATTIREYFQALMTELWTEAEGFSGKRPLGNGNWQFCVYAALITAGMVKGKVNEEHEVSSVDYKAADALILEAIRGL